MALTFLLGNGVPAWRNAAVSLIVFVLAATTMALVVLEGRRLKAAVPDSTHKGVGVAELIFALIVVVVVGPMLLIMPFVFLGAVT